MLWGNARRTVKRNSKKRDKDAHSGTKCDSKKPLPTKSKIVGMRGWMFVLVELGRGVETNNGKRDEFKCTN